MDGKLRDVLKLYLLNKSFLVVVSVLAAAFLPLGAGYKINTPGPLNRWAQWDGEAYITIAEKGYVTLPDGRTLHNFLPLYPFAIRLANFVFSDFGLSALILSNAFFLAALYFLYLLAESEFGNNIAKKSVVLLAFFPTAFFFSAVYTEAMFLAVAIPAFYYARKGRWMLSGVLAAFLPFIRIVGLLFWIVLAVEYFQQKGFRLSKNVSGPLLALAGVAAFFAFSYFSTGTLFGYANQQNLWTRAISSPHVALLNAADLLFRGPIFAIYSLWNLSVLAFFIATLYASRKMPRSYTAYMFLTMILTLFSSTLEGFSRFVLVCFPSFMILAKFTEERKSLFMAVAALLVLGLALLTARFVTGAVGTVIG